MPKFVFLIPRVVDCRTLFYGVRVLVPIIVFRVFLCSNVRRSEPTFDLQIKGLFSGPGGSLSNGLQFGRLTLAFGDGLGFPDHRVPRKAPVSVDKRRIDADEASVDEILVEYFAVAVVGVARRVDEDGLEGLTPRYVQAVGLLLLGQDHEDVVAGRRHPRLHEAVGLVTLALRLGISIRWRRHDGADLGSDGLSRKLGKLAVEEPDVGATDVVLVAGVDEANFDGVDGDVVEDEGSGPVSVLGQASDVQPLEAEREVTDFILGTSDL